MQAYFSALLKSWPRSFTSFLSWIGELRKADTLRADIIAGITVALVLVPQSMAYAQLAGLPVQYGLYASFLPPMVAAIFGSSRQLATGPVAVVSLMTAAGLEPIVGNSPESFFVYVAILTLMVGTFQLLLGLFRMGVLVDFLSHPVVIGFTNAGALIIASSQMNKLFGVSVEKAAHHYETVWRMAEAAWHSTHLPTLAMSILALGLMIGVKRFFPSLPSVLFAVVITTVLSWQMDYAGMGAAIVGKVPSGLPSVSLPQFDVSALLQLAVTAVVISLVGFMEAISIAKAMAAETRQRLDVNQELVGQGLSNLISSVTSGYPVSGSFSRSAVNINAGAATGFSSVVTGLAVGLTLLVLTPLLYYLPVATLAAVIIIAVIGLIKIEPIIHAWHAEPHDGIVAVITFILTLVFAPHLEKGIMIGVMLSLVLFVMRTMRPRIAELARYPDGGMRDVAIHEELKVSPKIAVVRFDMSLYFANAGYFESRMLEIVASRPELKYIIIDAEGINGMDATGEKALFNLWERLQAQGVEIVIARMKRQFMSVVRRTRLFDTMGADHFFSRIGIALEWVYSQLGDEYDRKHCPLAPISVSKQTRPKLL